MVGRPPFAGQPDRSVADRAAAKLARLRAESLADDPLPVLLRAVEAMPEDLVLRDRLASLYLTRGEFASAAEAWERVLEKLPGRVPARIGLGCALVGVGRADEAEAHFERALRTSRDPAWARERIDACRERAESARGAAGPASATTASRPEG